MSQTNSHGFLPMDAYGKSMKLLLVDFINHQNNRSIDPSNIQFDIPTYSEVSGTISVPVRFSSGTGWDTSDVSYMEYQRQPIADTVPNGQFTIHMETLSDENILSAIFEQYGFFIDPDTFFLEEVVSGDSSGDSDSGTIDPEGDDGTTGDIDGDPIDGEPIPEGSVTSTEENPITTDVYYKLTFLDNHLLFEGSVDIRIVSSIDALGTTISRLLDIRQYYTDVEAGRYPFSMYIKTFKLGFEKDEGNLLHLMKPDTINLEDLAVMLSNVTGDTWVDSDTPCNFNVHDASFIYNGLRRAGTPDVDISYPFTLVIELSNEFCDNLSGQIVFNYRHDYRSHPGYVGGRYIRPVPILN